MFLGCDMPIQLLLSSDYDNYDRLEDLIDWKMFHHVLIHLTNYKICNILCLNKINRLTCFSTCNLPITAASLC